MSEEKKNVLLNVPIDPEVQLKTHAVYDDPERCETGNLLEMTDGTVFDSNIFAVLRAIGRVFYKGTEWNKKARIVFEYDPRQKRMTVSSFMESDEPNQGEDLV